MKFQLTVALALLSLSLTACQPSEENKKNVLPNFIVIFADDLGYGDLGNFGHPTIKTPNLDQMALEGIRLTQFYSAASICTPSRAGLLTGKLPIRTGMTGKRGVLFPDSGGGLPSSEITIAKALKSKNYSTACIGKWHLGHLKQFLPTAHGFDYYFGIPYSNDMSPATNNWDYAKAAFPELPLMENTSVIETEPDQSQLTKRYTDRAIEFIEDNKNNPFFLYMPQTFPHIPLFVDSLNAGKTKRGLYGDVVRVLDWSVGEILNTLKKYNLDKNTFVIFTSDNGPWGWAGINGGSAGLLSGAKGSPWEGGFRVPAIAWMPGTIPPNTVSDAIGSTLDLFPTFMNMAQIDIDDNAVFDGLDISQTFSEQKEIQQNVFYYTQTSLKAYRSGSWKIFVRDPNPWNDEITDSDLPLLYNIDEDPSEKFNVASKYPETVRKLTEQVKVHENSIIDVPSQLDLILDEFKEKYDQYNN